MKKPIEKEFQYQQYPALAEYIKRIGAEQLNFKKFIVKEHKGNYYTEKAIITIDKDKVISCKTKEYKPSDEEVEAIKSELADVKWPIAIGARNIDALKKILHSNGEDLYEFWNRKTGTITMVQQKVVLKDGSKAYLPWTMFDDGKWLQMEPDGDLPFWKPRKRSKAKIMVHEGAKCGKYADWFCTSDDKEAIALRKTHPWVDEMSDYEHWGMIGGALAPQRTDYDELAREKPTEVVYFCDNDWKGKKAIEGVSRCWEKSLKGIILDNRWPESWDIAEKLNAEICPRLFAKGTGRYIGPSLKSLMFSATFATKHVYAADGAGRPVIACREEFLQEWYHCIRPEVFVHKDRPDRQYILQEFNSLVQPFSHTKETGQVVKSDQVHKGGILSYNPSKPSGISIDTYGNIIINTHVPSNVVMEKGDYKIWDEYVKMLFPIEEDRGNALKWIATLIDHPEIKMHYGMLLISRTQGVGKTTLGQNILAPLMGDGNTSVPSEYDIVEAQFNYWAPQKRLTIVNEIYAGHNSKAYDKLKSIVTDSTIQVSKKYQAGYEIENWLHVFACSNSFRALKLSDDDRRWFVPRVTEEKKNPEYWNKLHDWLDYDNGLGKIKHWAKVYCEKNGHVLTGDSAPWSTVKKQVIEESMSPGQLAVMNLLNYMLEKNNGSGTGVITSDMHLQQYLREVLYEGRPNQWLESLLTIRKIASNNNWHVGTEKTQKGEFGGGPAGAASLLFSDVSDKDKSIKQLQEKGRKPFNLKDLTTNL